MNTIDIPGVPEGYVAVWHNELAEGTLYWNDLNQIGRGDSASGVRGISTSNQRRVVFVKAVPPRNGWWLEDANEVRYYTDGRVQWRVHMDAYGGNKAYSAEAQAARAELVKALSGLPRVEG